MTPNGSEIHDWLDGLARRVRPPRATYRVQFSPAFTLQAAIDLCAYLADLGVSHLYASPLLRAGADSTHGYDIVDHNALNPNLGGQDDFARLGQALRARGLGLILDIVPNHMGIADPANGWWQDVLENGPASPVARYFDINWHPVARELENKIVLPILEDQYGKVLEDGKFRLSREGGAFVIYYYGYRLPVAAHTVAPILTGRIEDLKRELGEQSEPFTELLSIVTAIGHLPPPAEMPPEKIAERNREKEIVKRRIAALADSCEPLRRALDETVEAFNGTPGRPDAFNALDGLIEAQSWRPAFWRVAGEEINFRRFFEINTLAAVRVELPEVFEATHDLILKFVAEGRVDGLRVDHPDGLWDPAQYLRRLQIYTVAEKFQAERGKVEDPEALRRAIGDWLDGRAAARAEGNLEAWPFYIVAEKILGQDEPLPLDWMAEGTTGYDFLRVADGLAVDSTNRRALDRAYAHFIGARLWFPDIVYDAKLTTMRVSFVGEVWTLALQLAAIARRNRRTRDFTLGGLRFALREIIAALPVYRTYIATRAPEISARDRGYLESAVAEARRRNARLPAAVFDFVGDTLLLRNLNEFPPALHRDVIEFLVSSSRSPAPSWPRGSRTPRSTSTIAWRRSTKSAAAPTASARRARNSRSHADRRRLWPRTMLAGSTHDTKRSEDGAPESRCCPRCPGPGARRWAAGAVATPRAR